MSISFPESLIGTLRAARHIAVLTGAGISAESGVPTFREAQTGLWEQYDPTELATPQAFRRDPKLVWEWYAWRRGLVTQAKPNPGHLALAELEARRMSHGLRFTLITQNVDDLHHRAGNINIIELHGNLYRTKCFTENVVVETWPETQDVPPRCPRCGGLLRPDVVWFNEQLPADALNAAISAANTCDIFLSIGTSSVVQPAASLAYSALEQGAPLIEINPADTPLTPLATYSLRGPSGQILPALVRALWPST
jgi:NAD-dependent protein deacetylase/lipoamidase